MSIKSQNKQLIMLVEAMNWPLITRLLSLAGQKELTASELAIEKTIMVSRIKLMTSAQLPFLPCRNWVLQVQNFSSSKKLSQQKVLIHFSPLQQQILFDYEQSSISHISTQYDTEFNYLRDLLYRETEKENYEKCSLIKKHIDTILEPGKPYTISPSQNKPLN